MVKGGKNEKKKRINGKKKLINYRII